MIFRYRAVDPNDQSKEGTIEAANMDVAISSLQRKGLVIVSILSVDDVPWWEKGMTFFSDTVSYKEVVVLSRQMSTLFGAQVSALRVFRLLASQNENLALRKKLDEVSDDIQGGMSMSNAMAKHPDVFSDFYVNMIRAGEESGNLAQTFAFLADYLDRSYELISRLRSALIYPAFVIIVFITVMVLMLVMVIPKLTAIITESGGEIPIYTRVVIALSDFMIHYGVLMLAFVVTAGFLIWRFAQTDDGKRFFGNVAINLPVMGDLMRKLYLARIADNMNTMLTSGIPVVRSVEVTSAIVGSPIYSAIFAKIAQDIRTGASLSRAMGEHKELPAIMVQMVKVGEETGEVGSILSTLAKFYKREVDSAVDGMIGLIEPAMIVLLGLGVGGLLVSVLMPIYSLTSAF